MLKKINFNIETFEHLLFISDVNIYVDFIKEVFHKGVYYDFEYNAPFVIHLFDNNGNVYYHESLCIIDKQKIDCNSIIKSFTNIINIVNLLEQSNSLSSVSVNGETHINIYLDNCYVSHINREYLFRCKNDSDIELKKMKRDIGLFDAHDEINLI